SGQLCCDGHCKSVEPGTTTCPAPQCGPDHPCGEGHICDGGVCWRLCGDGLPSCPDGSYCHSAGVCKEQPPSDCGPERPCAVGKVCDQGTCRLRCGPDFPDQHCPAPSVCIENYICR
ncbi:MAG TPA: hypothetical protein VFB81_02400, partial [Myxococcales bacterium]|nr:hypothetical protein [Myxococcales bacterium]